MKVETWVNVSIFVCWKNMFFSFKIVFFFDKTTFSSYIISLLGSSYQYWSYYVYCSGFLWIVLFIYITSLLYLLYVLFEKKTSESYC